MSGLWLPWGIPYLDATLGACPAQGSEDIDSCTYPGRRS